jgi:hypothetical protein
MLRAFCLDVGDGTHCRNSSSAMRRQTAQQENKARSERGDYAKIRMCDFRSARVSADDKPDAMQNPHLH